MNVGPLISLAGSLKKKKQPNESCAKKAPLYSHEHHEEEGCEYENEFMTWWKNGEARLLNLYQAVEKFR